MSLVSTVLKMLINNRRRSHRNPMHSRYKAVPSQLKKKKRNIRKM